MSFLTWLPSTPISVLLGAVLLLVPSRVDAPTPGAATAPVQARRSSTQDGFYQVPYNGIFTFTRLSYRGSNSWNHDWPAADRNMQFIIDGFTYMRSNTVGSNVLDLEDPRIFQHPILYMSEPGFWGATDEGLANLRQFLLKGGFLMFDDFELEQWDNMAAHMRRVLPEYDWFEIDDTHPIFRSFFGVLDIYVPHPLVPVIPKYQAIFEDNDPSKRIMVLANHNSDLAEYWEWSNDGVFGMDPTNDAYRLGANYIIYAVIH